MRHTGGLDLEMKDCKHDEKCTVRVEKKRKDKGKENCVPFAPVYKN